MLAESRYLKIVRMSAWYDLVVTAAFATPWSFAVVLTSLADLAQQLALPGSVPVFEAAHRSEERRVSPGQSCCFGTRRPFGGDTTRRCASRLRSGRSLPLHMGPARSFWPSACLSWCLACCRACRCGARLPDRRLARVTLAGESPGF